MSHCRFYHGGQVVLSSLHPIIQTFVIERLQKEWLDKQMAMAIGRPGGKSTLPAEWAAKQQEILKAAEDANNQENANAIS